MPISNNVFFAGTKSDLGSEIRELRQTGFSGTAAVKGFYQDAVDVYHKQQAFRAGGYPRHLLRRQFRTATEAAGCLR